MITAPGLLIVAFGQVNVVIKIRDEKRIIYNFANVIEPLLDKRYCDEEI